MAAAGACWPTWSAGKGGAEETRTAWARIGAFARLGRVGSLRYGLWSRVTNCGGYRGGDSAAVGTTDQSAQRQYRGSIQKKSVQWYSSTITAAVPSVQSCGRAAARDEALEGLEGGRAKRGARGKVGDGRNARKARTRGLQGYGREDPYRWDGDMQHGTDPAMGACRPCEATLSQQPTLLTVNGSPLMATRTITSIGPYFSKDGVLHVISVEETNLPGTVASRRPSENLT